MTLGLKLRLKAIRDRMSKEVERIVMVMVKILEEPIDEPG